MKIMSETLHPINAWEKCKKSIQERAKKIGKVVKDERQLIISQLLEKVEDLQSRLPLNRDEDRLLIDSKIELDQKVDENAKGIIFRSRAKWAEYGERSSKYFFNLEKSRYNAKTCMVLIGPDGAELNTDRDILDMQRSFYQDLYQADKEAKFCLVNEFSVHVSDKEVEKQGQEISQGEILGAIKQLKSGKTPGSDGLPIEFYKTFANKVSQILLKIYTCAYEERKMPQTSMAGILNLIPKPGKDMRYINNLRPITLLNTDYKIIEKVLANRMSEAMEEIIHSDQKGFMPGRRISTNIRKLLDIMRYADEEKIEAFILSLDFKKCFDRISFSAIIGALNFFGFADYIVEWTKLLYTDFVVNIQNNGKFSESIRIERSVHQGGVNSVNLFLCVAEILALSLRANKEIDGIPVQDIINLLNQYADDLDVCSLFTQNSLDNILQGIEIFGRNTGFAVNYDKTKIYRVGSLKNSDATLYTQREIAWTNEPINVLGIWICHDEEMSIKLNYEPLIDKTKQILESWENWSLSLIGKILVVNTMVASLFVYKMLVLPSPPETVFKRVEQLIQEYLWDKKRPKIPLDILQRDGTQGGLKLVDLRCRDQALKVSWIQILEHDKSMATLAFNAVNDHLREWIFDCNLQPEDVKHLEIKDKFWHQVMLAWCNYNYQPGTDNDIIWYNSRVRVQGIPFCWTHCLKKGLFRVSQLYRNGVLISIKEAAEEYGLTFMEFHSLISAIPEDIKKLVRCSSERTINSRYAIDLDRNKLPKHVYKTLILKKSDEKIIRIKSRWEKALNRSFGLSELYEIVSEIFCTTNVPKLRSFQYRLVMHAITNNCHLKRWKIKESDSCSFCNLQPETNDHLFFECIDVKRMWSFLGINIPNCEDLLTANKFEILFNKVNCNKYHVANFICLVAKQYVYRQRCLKRQINVFELKGKIKLIENTEKYIAIKNNRLAVHNKKWKL